MSRERPAGPPVDLSEHVQFGPDAEYISRGRGDGGTDEFVVVNGQAYPVGQG